MAGNKEDRHLPPPPSYEDVIGTSIGSGLSGQAASLITMPEEDEEMALLKSELRRLQEQNMQQRKLLMRQEIEKERMKASGLQVVEPSVTTDSRLQPSAPREEIGTVSPNRGADRGNNVPVTYHPQQSQIAENVNGAALSEEDEGLSDQRCCAWFWIIICFLAMVFVLLYIFLS